MANNLIIERLEGVKTRFIEVGELLTQPDVLSDMERYIKLNREYKDLQPIIEAYENYKLTLSNITSTKDLLATEKDEEMREMAKSELEELNARIPEMEEEIKLLLIPADPEDDKDAVLEIRAGTGGDEASIFAGDLFRMYSKFFEQKGWKAEINSYSLGTAGGYKEIVFSVSGEGVYGIMKYESGVHRVQRVPQTETQGRIHTSAATVVVLPEADEFDVEIKNEDIRKDTYCSSGPGGQSVNTTYSAIRLTHIPTGIVVVCQQDRSQLGNRELAMQMLKSRLYEMELQKRNELKDATNAKKKKIEWGSQIRSYVFHPYKMIKDHRTDYEVGNIGPVMDGELDGFIKAYLMSEKEAEAK